MGYYYIGGVPYNGRQWFIVCMTSVLAVLSTLAVALRLYARYLTVRRLYLDDVFIIVGLVLSWGNCVLEYVGLFYGLGRHASDVGELKAMRYLLVLYILQMLWNTTLPIVKASILLFIRRLFPTPRMKQITTGLLIFLVIWYVAFQLTAIFQCTPVHFYWNRTIPGGHCVNDIPFFIALAATNTVTDIMLLALPLPTVWSLKVTRAKRIALSAVFILGAFVCAVALYRISTLPQIDPRDITWSNTYAGIWTAIEGSVGVIVACLPSMMPIWRRLRGRAADYPYISSQGNKYDGNIYNSKGLQSAVSRSRVSRAHREGFETVTTSPERTQSQERIINNSSAVVATRSTDTDDGDRTTGQGEIRVVTEVQQDIELRHLP